MKKNEKEEKKNKRNQKKMNEWRKETRRKDKKRGMMQIEKNGKRTAKVRKTGRGRR